MTNEINENDDSTNVEVVEEVEEVIEEEVAEVEEEEANDGNEELEALKKENKTLKIQKAKLKEKSEAPANQENKELSQSDLIALIKGDVAEEDIQEVRDYAELKGISVVDALKSNVVRTLMKENTELRNTANATNTGTTKRSAKEVTNADLLANAKKGQLPESDADIRRLTEAQLGL